MKPSKIIRFFFFFIDNNKKGILINFQEREKEELWMRRYSHIPHQNHSQRGGSLL